MEGSSLRKLGVLCLTLVLTKGLLGQSLVFSYQDIYSGESFVFAYGKSLNEGKSEIQFGLKYQYSRYYDRDNQSNVFKKRLSPNSFLEHFGFKAQYNKHLFGFFEEHSIWFSSSINVAYSSLSSDNYTLSPFLDPFGSPLYYFDRFKDGPAIWLEPQIGLLLKIDLNEKLDLISTLGAGFSIMHADFEHLLGRTYFGLSTPFSVRLQYYLD